MDPDNPSFQEHMDSLKVEVVRCSFCQGEHPESETTRIILTGDRICYTCQKNWTVVDAISYIKNNNDDEQEVMSDLMVILCQLYTRLQ